MFKVLFVLGLLSAFHCQKNLLPIPPGMPVVPPVPAPPAAPGMPAVPITQQCSIRGQECGGAGQLPCCAQYQCQPSATGKGMCWPTVQSPACIKDNERCKIVDELCCVGSTCVEPSVLAPDFGTCKPKPGGK